MILPAHHGSKSRANAADSAIERFRRMGASEIINYILTYRQARRIHQSLSADTFDDLERRFKDADPAPGYSKYLDVQHWIHVKLRRARALGLHKTPGRRVLDLGTGTGYFPFLAKLLGNEAVALDVGDVLFYDEMIEALGVERHLGTITSFKPLPELGKFDLITAFQICFDRNTDGQNWGVHEWDFFRRDVTDHLLAPGGQLVLEFNTPPSAEVSEYFASTGAKVDNLVISGSRPSR